MIKLKVLDLFSGIGGFSLGLERTGGFETVAFCEIEPYPRAVLKRHWPQVPCYDDVRTLTADTLRRDGITVDVICGGFPCQDISTAGKGIGLAGERSGLWREYARLIGELRPRFVIVENVAALLGRGLGDVLGDLSSLGYDAEWHCIPASAVGAPHQRDRLWIVANARGGRQDKQIGWEMEQSRGAEATRASQIMANSNRSRKSQQAGRKCKKRLGVIVGGKDVADTDARNVIGGGGALQMGWGRFARQAIEDGDAGGIEWSPEPDVGRVAHGVSARVDRLGGLGNAVVPQIPELIGRAILQAEGLTP